MEQASDMLDTLDADLRNAILRFLNEWNRLLDAHSANFKRTVRAEVISSGWARVWSDHTCMAWIRLKDGQTKTLGALFRGDVHKPASWRGAAKHARGNVFMETYAFIGPYGVAYLKDLR